MGHLSGIETVFYQVCNMERSVEFYGTVLGLPLRRREGNDWAEFELGRGELALAGELATAPHGGGATVVMTCDDATAFEAHLAAHDVQRGKVEDMGGALSLDFYDPDGNQLVALQQVG